MRKFGLALALIGLVAGTGQIAHGAANERSNCIAVLTSAYGPNPAARVDEAVHELQVIADELGVPPGVVASRLAQSAGTLEECFILAEGGGQ